MDLILHGNTKAILCHCCRFSTLSLTYKTKMYNHTDQPRTLPPEALSLQVFFSLLSVLGAPWLSDWLCYSRCVWLSSQGVCLFLSLTHFFSLPFFFSPLFLSPSTSQAFSVELYSFIPETLRVLFRDVSAQNAHTQSARRWGRGRVSEKLPHQTALLSFTSATNKRQSFFLPIVCER